VSLSEAVLKRNAKARAAAGLFARNLGARLTEKLGRTRLRDVGAEIADFQEQVAWPNTEQELRRLTDKIQHIPARMGLTLGSARLSRQAGADVLAALWRTLKRSFRSLPIKPTH
jgi:hypothetical protein